MGLGSSKPKVPSPKSKPKSRAKTPPKAPVYVSSSSSSSSSSEEEEVKVLTPAELRAQAEKYIDSQEEISRRIQEGNEKNRQAYRTNKATGEHGPNQSLHGLTGSRYKPLTKNNEKRKYRPA